MKRYIMYMWCRICQTYARWAYMVVVSMGFGLCTWYENKELEDRLWKAHIKDCRQILRKGVEKKDDDISADI